MNMVSYHDFYIIGEFNGSDAEQNMLYIAESIV